MTPSLVEDRTPPEQAAVDAATPAADRPTADLGPCGGAAPGSWSGVADSSAYPATHVVELKPDAADPYPQPGGWFERFEILSELGRGAMGRVYLARQQTPVARVVVLKVGQHLSSECQKLAKLQHPNVVPVYSFHQHDRLQAVCMPYRGPLTLRHLVARLRSENLHTLDGRAFTTVISECRKVREPAVHPTPTPEPAAAGGGVAPEPVIPAPTTHLFAGLRRLSYVDAVLTIIRQATEGLRAAHAERIVHCDLKPGNVLIADDGCAQLIDFGVAYDKADLAATRLLFGGTRPYMSPEQLRSCTTTALEHDERSDLYAVGVMLYELLTGRLPFAADSDPTPAAIDRDVENRFRPPTPIRRHATRVPHAVASIVDKCLAPQVAGRYQTAAQLLEDLDRQIARQPLKFAPNTSTRERVGKWVTRNRVALVIGALLGAIGVAAGSLFHRDTHHRDEIRRLEVAVAAEAFTADREEAEFCFFPAERDPEYRRRAWAAARAALDRLGAWDDDGWFHRPEFLSLPPDGLDAYRRRVAGLMLLLANSRAQEAAQMPAGAAHDATLREAMHWNRRAERTHPAPSACRVIWSQRGFLARLSGDQVEADRYTRQANALPRVPSEAVLEGRQSVAEGRTHAALATFADAARADPRNFWAVFYVAVCQQIHGDYREAAAGYDICAALRPGYFATHYNRGQVRLRLGRDYARRAEEDFDRALDARPGWADAHLERALAREVQGRYADALADLNTALNLGYTPTSVYLARSRVCGRMGQTAAAERDFADAIKTVPADERGWLARAQAQLYRNPTGALSDYAEALKLNPRLVPALQGTAHLLARSGKTAESAAALTRIIEINPDAPDPWAGRGVLRARLDDRDGALADAREALRLTQRPATQYQVAGIYAMTSRSHPEDRLEALSLLDAALRAGFGFDLLDKDKELDGLREDPEFLRMVAAARKYRESLKRVD
jgi:serine/threonine protein kinase/Tfp pilus assembly protein PilF